MTLLAERPATTESTRITSDRVADAALRGGSYVTLPAGSTAAPVEGTYVTSAGSLRPASHGSYITVDGTPTVPAGTIQGGYVTVPAAA